MRVLYVAPRMHPNQIPVIRGWLRNGYQVMFISQFAGKGEDHTDLEPVVLGYSRIFDFFMSLYKRLVRRGKLTEKQEFDIRIKAGFPPLFKMARLIRGFSPDLTIMRERSLYNIPVYLLCRLRRSEALLYNQSPLWDDPDRDSGLGHRLLITMLPKQRMTPVYGDPQAAGSVKMKNSWFVPFVAEPFLERMADSYCRDGIVRMVCIGRYEERKRLFMLLEAVRDFLLQGSMRLEIAGEAQDEEQKRYYDSLLRFVRENGMGGAVTLRRNLPRDEVFAIYCRSDLFVLPSTRERASVAQLEAMSCSLPVICSDTNGSSCYIRHGENGYLFRDDCCEDLREKIESLLAHRELIPQMGRAGYRMIREEYGFANYLEAVRTIPGTIPEADKAARRRNKKSYEKS